MGQFVAGLFLFLVPGTLPAYVQYRDGGKDSRIMTVVSVFLYDFLILVCTGGAAYLLFGDVVFSIKYDPYLLLYVFWFVGAYGFSFVLGILTGMKKPGTLRGLGRAGVLFGSVLWIVFLAGLFYDDYAKRHLAINEVCSHNLSLALDGNGENSDYIELYNPSFTQVSLDGFCLTDQETAEEARRLPEITIAPRSYLLLFADGTARTVRDEETGETLVYLGFRLNEMGETLTLFDRGGAVIDRVETPRLGADVTYARLRDGRGAFDIVKNGTPGASNETLESYVIPTLAVPVFSEESGFYEQPFALSLRAGEGEKIYYTLDGSAPTADAALYTSPILIEDASGRENYYANIENIARDGDYQPDHLLDKGTVVRAVCVNETGEVSEIASRSYFVGFGEKSGYDRVQVLSVAAAEDDFFSPDRGIYVLGDTYREWLENYRAYRDYGNVAWRSFAANYTHSDKTKERPVTVALFDTEGGLVSEERIGVRVRGGSSRNLRQKGFNFYAREEYGEDPLGLAAKMLRTSGSIDTNVTMLRDVFNQSLVADRRLDIQPGEPCQVFLNGEYWGLYNLQTRFTGKYFEEQYGIDRDNVVMVKQGSRVSIGTDGDMGLYEELLTFAKEQDLSRPEAYEKISQMMDIQSFIDHYCFEIYIANTDWPLNNVCCWRTRTAGQTSEPGRTSEPGQTAESGRASEYADGRWRWGLYDTDESTGIYEDGMGTYAADPFSEESHWFGTPLETPLMSDLIQNEAFRKQFTLTFMDMVNQNFAYESVHDKLYRMAAVYAEPMVKSYHRFNPGEFTQDTFWDNIAIIDEFYEKRADYVVADFAGALGLTGREGTVTLQTAWKEPETGEETLSSACGSIALNTILPELSQGEWSGGYLTDYPVTVTAHPAEGYRFAGWYQYAGGEGGFVSEQESLEAEVRAEGICLRAVFEPTE